MFFQMKMILHENLNVIFTQKTTSTLAQPMPLVMKEARSGLDLKISGNFMLLCEFDPVIQPSW